MAKNRGNKPSRPAGNLRETVQPRNYDEQTPKFCLHYLRGGFDVHALETQQQVAFAKTLQRLCRLTWRQIKLADKHGNGSELIDARSFKAPVPLTFQDAPKFLVLRYAGMLPMAGVRVDDVYHILWIEPEFNKLYNHS
jgi:hypothetical protein